MPSAAFRTATLISYRLLASELTFPTKTAPLSSSTEPKYTIPLDYKCAPNHVFKFYGQTQPASKYLNSLRQTSFQFQKKFGIGKRYTVPHMPIFLNRPALSALTAAFPEAVRKTLSHRFRHNEDLQYASAYTSFVREALQPYSADALFQLVDLDKDGRIDDDEFELLTVQWSNLLGNPMELRLVQETLKDALEDCKVENAYPRASCMESFRNLEQNFSLLFPIPTEMRKYL